MYEVETRDCQLLIISHHWIPVQCDERQAGLETSSIPVSSSIQDIRSWSGVAQCPHLSLSLSLFILRTYCLVPLGDGVSAGAHLHVHVWIEFLSGERE